MPLANADSFKIPLCDKSVHCIITSIPYFGLRIYDGARPTVFGGRVDCAHDWVAYHHNPQPHGDDGTSGNLEGGRTTQAQTRMGDIETAECRLCGAWCGFFGGEKQHDCLAWAREEEPCGRCFMCHFRELAREMWRVLRDDGTVWLVIGDSYAGGGRGGNPEESAFRKQATNVGSLIARTPIPNGLKPKDKVMVPERVRLALQADGWYVRSVSPWLKRNSMPESTTDRPGVATEDIILLTKSVRYFYDAVAVFKSSKYFGVYPRSYNGNIRYKGGKRNGAKGQGQEAFVKINPTRNRRTTDWFLESLDAQIEETERQLAYLKASRTGGMMVGDDEGGLPLAFIINPKGYRGAHYATFPIDLITPMILASTSAHGVCPKCGAQWERVAEKERVQRDELPQDHPDYRPRRYTRKAGGNDEYSNGGAQAFSFVKTIGWRPTCDCYDDLYRSEWPRTHNARKRAQQDARGDWFPRARQRSGSPDWPKVPAIVLDSFVGSGTTVEAARRLGRIGIGFDVSMKYLRENALPRAEQTNTTQSMQTLPLFQEVMA